MGGERDDIVRDILRRVMESLSSTSESGFSDGMAVEIERQVRRDWGGERPYIAHDNDTRRAERDDKIRAAWQAGQHDVASLATRFGISSRQVRRIVALDE